MRLCTKAQSRRNEKETSETRSKQAVLFDQHIPTSCQVVQVSTTDRATLLLTTSGQVFSWGEVKCKALGRKAISASDANQVNLIPALRDRFIAYIACGSEHVLALLSSFTVWSWGENTKGQLGLGHVREVEEPGVVEGQLKGQVIICLKAWENSSFAVTLKNEFFMWGDNTHLVADGADVSMESGHYGHYLDPEYSSLSYISTPVQLYPNQETDSSPTEEEKSPEEVKQIGELAIAVDPEGNLHFFHSLSELEVLSAIISQEAVTSMSQENEDLGLRIKELQSRFDYLDFHKSSMPTDWAKNENLKYLEIEINRLESLLETSTRESEDIKEKMKALEHEKSAYEKKKEAITAAQKNAWDRLKQAYDSTHEEETALPGISDSVQQVTTEGVNTDEKITQVEEQYNRLNEQLYVHEQNEQRVEKELEVHNNMKFMIRKQLSYANFNFDPSSEQRRIDELLAIQEEVNELRVVDRIQPPLSPQDLQGLATDISMYKTKLKKLEYPISSALFQAIVKTRNVLVTHLDLLDELINIKGVDPDRTMNVDENALVEFSWGEYKTS